MTYLIGQANTSRPAEQAHFWQCRVVPVLEAWPVGKERAMRLIPTGGKAKDNVAGNAIGQRSKFVSSAPHPS